MPVVSAVVLCDRIVSDALSGKDMLSGVFHRIILRDSLLPAVPFCIFTSISGGSGNIQIGVEMVSPTGAGQRIGETKVKLDPNAIIFGVTTVRGIHFKESGLHKFFVVCDGRQIGNPARLEVVFQKIEDQNDA